MIKLFDDPVKTPKKSRRKTEVRTIGTQVPEEMYKIIKEHIIRKEYVSTSDYIRDLIRKDLKERGLL